MMKTLIFFFVSIISFSWADRSKGYVEVQDLNDLKILTPSLSQRQTAKIRLDNGL